MKRLRILVVDDSALVRKTIRELLATDERFEVVGEAGNGCEALQMVERLRPDVVTLDLDMPVMDGLAALPRLIRDFRQRVLVLSTLTTANSYPTFKALALGAVDFITKPATGAYLRNLAELGAELRRKLKVAASVEPQRIGRWVSRADQAPPKEEVHVAPSPQDSPVRRPERVLGIGGSTGGTAALERILVELPPTLSVSVVVVQHLPTGFSRPFASYLATICPLAAKEAEDGEQLAAGSVYLAPGGGHLRVQEAKGELRLRVDPCGQRMHGFRPAIDALFYSIALALRRRAVAVLLSGMGGDGCYGLAAVRSLGGRTLVQDPESCVVPEMPTRATALGAAERSIPLDGLAAVLGSVLQPGGKTWIQAN